MGYVVLYVNSGVTYANHPSMALLQEMYTLFRLLYRRKMEKFYVLHPGLWFRAAVALSCAYRWAWHSEDAWDSAVYLENMQEVGVFFETSEVQLPTWVLEYDQQ